MKEPVWVLKPAVLAVHDLLISRFGGSSGIRDEGLLDSAPARPGNIHHYDDCRDVSTLAAAYAAAIIQNHPFIDGNKRIGFVAAYMFLDLNGPTLTADEAAATTMTLASRPARPGYRGAALASSGFAQMPICPSLSMRMR